VADLEVALKVLKINGGFDADSHHSPALT
jgi:hypothetical protein